MKVAVTLLILGVLLAAIGIGIWVDATTPKRVGYRVIEPSGEGAGPAAGLTVIGGSLAIGGIIRMIIKREDKSK